MPAPSYPPSTGVETSTGATAISLSATDLTAIDTAFSDWTGFVQWGCAVQPATTLDAAVITATGVEWAFGQMEPEPGCLATQAGQKFNPAEAPPFSTGQATSSGIFEKQPNGSWTMNYFESDPFPCPDHPPAEAPGPDAPFVPLAVLNAVSVPYASSSACASVYVPPAPR
jgi:hypothetical protein